MDKAYLVRYGEISLKGLNRNYFENKLASNIKFCLGRNKIMFRVEKLRGRVIVYSEDDCSCLADVFGITSFSAAVVVDLAKINNIVLDIIKDKKFRSFKISAKRLDSSSKRTSMELNCELGELVMKHKKTKVDLTNPALDIGIEIIKGNAYIFTERTEALCGLPVGVEGSAIAFLENDDSIVAAFLAMKRGCSITPVALDELDIKALEKFSNHELKLVKIKDYSEIDKIAAEYNALAVISGSREYLAKSSLKTTVFYPLIGYNNREITRLKKLINS